MSQIIAIINKNFAELDAETRTKVYYSNANQVALTEGLLPNNLGTGLVFNDTNSNPAIAIYIDSTGKPILKVAKAGSNVITGTSDQLIFNSAQNGFKIAAVNTSTTPAYNFSTAASSYALASGSQVIPHGLGYIPAVVSFVSVSGAYYQMSATVYQGVSANSFIQTTYALSVDATNIYIQPTTFGFNVTVPTAIAQFPVKYYLLQETAN